jgi:hypothetical protein
MSAGPEIVGGQDGGVPADEHEVDAFVEQDLED